MKQNNLRIIIGICTIFFLGALWYLCTMQWQIISANRLPSPLASYKSLVQIINFPYGNGLLHQHILQSLKLVILGFVISGGLGVAFGLFIGYSRTADAFFNPIFQTLRPIPPLAWIPLAIIWLGIGDAAKLMVIHISAFVPSAINAYTGVRNIDKPIWEATQMLGISKPKMIFHVMIPASMPQIFTGLRLSLQASWTTLVAAELIGAIYGLGSVLNQATQDIYPSMILVIMLVIGILGFIMTIILGWFELWNLRWKRQIQ